MNNPLDFTINHKLKEYAPVIILTIAGLLIALAFFGDDSYLRLQALEASLEERISENEKERAKIRTLKNEIVGLQTNDRILEKKARNELGMSRPDEIVLIFRDEQK